MMKSGALEYGCISANITNKLVLLRVDVHCFFFAFTDFFMPYLLLISCTGLLLVWCKLISAVVATIISSHVMKCGCMRFWKLLRKLNVC